MRLIPMRDNPNDFAVLPEILLKYQLTNTSNKSNKQNINNKTNESLFSLSFFIWFIVVSIIPLITYHLFENEWEKYVIIMKQFIDTLILKYQK